MYNIGDLIVIKDKYRPDYNVIYVLIKCLNANINTWVCYDIAKQISPEITLSTIGYGFLVERIWNRV